MSKETVNRRFPFVPMRIKSVLEISRKIRLMTVCTRIINFFPGLQTTLLQAKIELLDREYLSIVLFTTLFYFLFSNVLLLTLALIAHVSANLFLIVFGASFALAFIVFVYLIAYPNLLVVRKVKDLERNLLFALRHLLIQVRSGVTLFDSMTSVSKANYGEISEEFTYAVRKISTGEFIADVLEELTVRNPALYFQRSIWQITYSIRSGSDIGRTLDNLVSNLSREQMVTMRNYGAQLNPFAFMYLMFGVVIPSLGITLMIILSSFSGLPVKKVYFWAVLIFLVIFQFSFIGLIKNKRPSVSVYV